jgi:hypothetical protein
MRRKETPILLGVAFLLSSGSSPLNAASIGIFKRSLALEPDWFVIRSPV